MEWKLCFWKSRSEDKIQAPPASARPQSDDLAASATKLTLGVSYESGGDEKTKPSANRRKKEWRIILTGEWRRILASAPSKSPLRRIWKSFALFKKKSQRSANQWDKSCFLFPFPTVADYAIFSFNIAKVKNPHARLRRKAETNYQQANLENLQPAIDCDDANDPKPQTPAKSNREDSQCSTWPSKKAMFARPACLRLIGKVYFG